LKRIVQAAAIMTRGRRARAVVAVIVSAVFSALLSALAPARADTLATDEPALPCRPTIACTAEIGPPGHLELEIGWLFRRAGGPAHQHSIPFLLKLTTTPWLQLQLGSNGPTFQNAPVATRYADDIVGAVKVHLPAQPPRWPSLSASIAFSVPLVAANGYARTYDILTTVYATQELGRSTPISTWA
jgi:hypothetical protein